MITRERAISTEISKLITTSSVSPSLPSAFTWVRVRDRVRVGVRVGVRAWARARARITTRDRVGGRS